MRKRNRIIGVTGGVGSGKSTFSKELGKFGAHIIDVDLLAERLSNENSEIQNALKNIFGEEIFNQNNQLNRRKLGRIVFSDRLLLNRLNEIYYPIIVKNLKDEISRVKQITQFIVVDMAILFETKIEFLFDLIVVVEASIQQRIKWLNKNRNWSRKEIMDRINCQMDIQEQKRRADWIVQNNSTKEHLRKQAKLFYTQFINLNTDL